MALISIMYVNCNMLIYKKIEREKWQNQIADHSDSWGEGGKQGKQYYKHYIFSHTRLINIYSIKLYKVPPFLPSSPLLISHFIPLPSQGRGQGWGLQFPLPTSLLSCSNQPYNTSLSAQFHPVTSLITLNKLSALAPNKSVRVVFMLSPTPFATENVG